jgi:SAM-dependent methyltransferase
MPPARIDRDPQQVRAHYEVERLLADRLRHASKEARRALYPTVYDELLRSVPDHPLKQSQRAPEDVARDVKYYLDMLSPFIRAENAFLEIGAGDCALSLAVAGMVKRVYAVDVSAEISSHVVPPTNFELVISDGTSIPVPAGSIDLAFSNQLMEHLHPDDAPEQLQQIFKALAPGGRYLCATPNRLNGPHDISRSFDTTATCLHLREYTVRELVPIMKHAGFRTVQVYYPSQHLCTPAGPVEAIEALLEALPVHMRRSLASREPLRRILGIRLVATK